MGHPDEKVAQASHSMFVGFLSSGNDFNEDERVSLKEQLVFYYIQRSLAVRKLLKAITGNLRIKFSPNFFFPNFFILFYG